jgi:SAM-dependent methyltransferase
VDSEPNSVSRFAARSDCYAAARPVYPAAAIDAVLAGLGDPAALTIADVGAGTGISSRLFAARGAKVIAIEPNDRMRAQAASHHNVRWIEGYADNTGLADASVDLAVACQAFHWFATLETMREFGRIARRRAALLQYERDERDAFTAAYGEIVRRYAHDDTETKRLRALEAFATFPHAAVTRTAAHFVQEMDRERLLERAASSSYLPSEGDDAEALRRELRELFARFERDGHVELRMVTYAMNANFDR